MARWGRAARLLRQPVGARVLDLGCAFGFGTRALAGRFEAYGHDLSAAYIERARRAVPHATFTVGPAACLPYPDAFFDAVLLLDVLEHVPDPTVVISEIARVLRPNGQLILSIPNRGLFATWDSLNLYRRLLGDGVPPPTDDPSWPQVHEHRHYSLQQIQTLLGDRFTLRHAEFTGIGVAEFINLVLLLMLRPFRLLHPAYAVLQYLYFGVYLAEDLLRTGPWGYHLMVEAERRRPATSVA